MATAIARSVRPEPADEPVGSVRLWLRLLSCTKIVEKRLRRRFIETFDTTLPRFDVMAALERAPAGLSMGELSQQLLVSNGNVTSIVQQLAQQGFVAVQSPDHDRRSVIARLTLEGARHFAMLAEAHHGWVEELLADIPEEARRELHVLLGTMRRSLVARVPR